MSDRLASILNVFLVIFTAFLAIMTLSFLVRPRNPKAAKDQDDCQGPDLDSPEHPKNRERPSEAPVVWDLELTDEGAMVDRCQYSDILWELRVEDPKIVVLYVHGWKHDASEDDADRVRFEEFIDDLSGAGEAPEGIDRSKRHVVGVYIGWKGHVPVGLLENLSFWNRKRAADRISQSAVLSKLIGAIAHITQDLQDDKDNLVILVGHSFGARMLFTAVSQVLLHKVQAAHPGKPGRYERIRGPADLVVLLNPAMEASIYTALDGVRREEERFAVDQQPLMLTISTDSDLATRWAFPVGQWLGLGFREAQAKTLGNFPRYITHELTPDSGHERLGSQVAAAQKTDSRWWDEYEGDGLSLVRRVAKRRDTPFIVAHTDGRVLPGHNRVWGRKFWNWLTGFVGEIDRRKEA